VKSTRMFLPASVTFTLVTTNIKLFGGLPRPVTCTRDLMEAKALLGELVV
jgi:hypothetical protein